ncbi:hypothetical protein EDB84DRAFT_1447613, partial [Lactarius hengduanensis]
MAMMPVAVFNYKIEVFFNFFYLQIDHVDSFVAPTHLQHSATAKLSAENAGSLELTSHRRAVASASLAAAPTPLLPVSESTPTGLESSDEPSSSPDPVSARMTKQPRAIPPAVSDNQGDDGNTTDVPDDAPAAKKVKTTSGQAIGLQADISIISIDDVDNLENERLNKSDPTADLKEFFSAMPPLPGQEKGRMLCKSCTQGLGCPKREKFLTNEHSTLRRHTASVHLRRYRKWTPKSANTSKRMAQSLVINHFCPEDPTARPIPFSEKALQTATLEWMVATNQPIQTFKNAAFKKMLNIASRANGAFDSHHPSSQGAPPLAIPTRISLSLGHWIEEQAPREWAIEQALLGFVQMNTSHIGMRLGQHYTGYATTSGLYP